MVVRVYIVEDEPLIAETIAIVLKRQGFSVIGEADNVLDAKREIRLFAPDLVLIDIQLAGEGSGVLIARDLDNLKIPYFYITSQTDLMTLQEVKGTSPLGYIAKPFTEAGLRSSIEVGWNTYRKSEPDYFTFNFEGAKVRISQEQIHYLEAFDNYCYLFTAEKRYLLPKTLKHIAELLNPDKFLKIHRSFWVNSSYVSSVSGSKVFIGSTVLPLSDSHRNKFLERFMGFKES